MWTIARVGLQMLAEMFLVPYAIFFLLPRLLYEVGNIRAAGLRRAEGEWFDGIRRIEFVQWLLGTAGVVPPSAFHGGCWAYPVERQKYVPGGRK